MRDRSWRRHQRARIKARHIRDYYALTSYDGGFGPRKDVATRHPMDCGKRCLICHWDKLMEPRRAREKRSWRER